MEGGDIQKSGKDDRSGPTEISVNPYRRLSSSDDAASQFGNTLLNYSWGQSLDIAQGDTYSNEIFLTRSFVPSLVIDNSIQQLPTLSVAALSMSQSCTLLHQ
jgi:hypothetical protein